MTAARLPWERFGESHAINMATIGIWNRRKRYMDEEFLFRDNKFFYSQIGLA
ncbi:hypothetical protein [Nonomuraea guangzhouensis]|uniref:Uncharacterized protein n=1 Tax=Nonomuraea guangzhouensis TaxID=1291555 RepID=A0ABW4GPS1_9ACTN|nr:hypothetical protein [Nonomuraea guangzhouensis]